MHFDGHGAYLPSSRLEGGGGVPTGAAMYGRLSPVREGTHGYLQPAQTATTTVVVVDRAGRARCGPIGRTADGQLTLNGTPVGSLLDIIPVTACPGPPR